MLFQLLKVIFVLKIRKQYQNKSHIQTRCSKFDLFHDSISIMYAYFSILKYVDIHVQTLLIPFLELHYSFQSYQVNSCIQFNNI